MSTLITETRIPRNGSKLGQPIYRNRVTGIEGDATPLVTVGEEFDEKSLSKQGFQIDRTGYLDIKLEPLVAKAKREGFGKLQSVGW